MKSTSGVKTLRITSCVMSLLPSPCQPLPPQQLRARNSKLKKAKVLFYDLETSPNLGYSWGKYEQNIIEFKKQWELLSVAYRWQGEKEIHCVARPDFKDKTDKSL